MSAKRGRRTCKAKRGRGACDREGRKTNEVRKKKQTDWKQDDELVLAPTDYHHEQAEQLVVKSEKKLADGDFVHLTKPLLAHTSSTYTGRQTSRHTHAHTH